MKNFSSDGLVIRLASWLLGLIPPKLGYPAASLVGKLVASQKNSYTVRAVYGNQQVLLEDFSDGTTLDQAVNAVFTNQAYSLYDYFHTFQQAEIKDQNVIITPSCSQWIEHCVQHNSPVIFAWPHLSNFDLGGRALIARGVQAQVLTLPSPKENVQAQNELRVKTGLEITPISAHSIKQAIRRLEAGGVILTSLDWPAAEANFQPRFFGRPAPLPTLHTRLALKTGAPVVILAVTRISSGLYQVDAQGPLPLNRMPDARQEILQNTEIILEAAAGIIRKAPRQWAMFHPVWPGTQI